MSDRPRTCSRARALPGQARMLPRQARASAAAFRALLARPHVRAVAATSLVARLPKGMLPLATVLMLHQSTGSYAIAGSAVALTALGDAASAPAQGRLADRFGRSRVLIPAAAAHVAAVAAMLVLVRDRAPAAAVAACACLAGIGLPPVSGSIKAAWPELAGQDALPAAYALESLLQQLVFLSGPLLVTAATMAAGPAAALICSAVLTAAGTLTFAATAARAVPVPRVMPTPRAVSARGADPRRRGGGAWRLPAVRILACGTMLQGLVFGALPVGIAAVTATAGLPDLAGILLAALTAGGVAGAFGPVTTDGQRRYVRLSAGLAVVLGAAAALSVKPSAGSVLGIAAALAVAGLFVTPIAAASYVLTQQAAPPATRTEAFTWLSTGQAVGSAAGAAVAGLLASTIGAAGALALLPVTVALSAVLVSARLPANQPRAATRAAGRRRGKRS